MRAALVIRLTLAALVLVLVTACRGQCPQPFDPDFGIPAPTDVSETGGGDSVDTSSTDLTTDLGADSKEDIGWLIEEGKFWLVNAEPGFALKFFQQALEIAPEDPDALFGAGLSEYVRSLELFAMIITLPAQFAGYLAGEGTRGEPESENDYLAEELRGIFLDLRAGFAAADSYLVQVDDPDFSWVIEGVPVYVLTRPVVVMRGRFDLADVYLIRSMNSFLLFSLDLLAAQDYHTDMLTAVYAAMDMKDEGAVDIWAVLSIVSELMAYDQRFFTLHEEDGPALFQDGVQRMYDTGHLLLKSLELLAEREEDGAGEVTTLTYNGKGDAVLVLTNGSDFYSGEEEPIDIVFPTELLEATQDILDAMKTPGTVLPFSLGPAVQLGTMFGILNRFGVLRFVPIEIPLPIDGLQPGDVTVLLSGFFADSIGFDYAGFAANPVGLRSFFPLLRKDPDLSGPEGFWMEWECLEELEETGFPLKGAGFLCSAGTALTDGPHFFGTPYELAPDDYPSPVPYMVWEDPTWGTLLAVDRNFLELKGETPDFVVPDLQLTNLGVHQWLAPVLQLLR